ncbi:LysR family transcriptional regulator [Streptomyces hoynatensis]|uniref:LysR family transcriptional regulator n=1 Tax=Streptomyces hoynatensis TaxID=1141874 RepID=A0A3A9YYP3_9ACTN|nr:LysR family transcriptional regulator [Streptomyces hoynatensis]RKN40834.1 LysR family transcriptional regulator [Streptomyces hoynatensis]
MLDLTRLRVLVAVAREGSVTAAAEALHYAQPSVSHHLARLEAEVGVPLVRRAGRGIMLTEAGRLLVTRAEEILGQVASAQAEVAAHAGLRTGRLRLAAFPSALATLVPAAAACLADRHPGVVLELTEAEPPEALTALRNAEVDAALIFEHGPPVPADRRNTTVTPLLEEPLYLVTPAGQAGAGGAGEEAGARAELAGYAEESWIAGCARCRAHLVSVCERAGFAPRITFETDDYVAVQALVAAGLGVSVLPGLAFAAHRHPGVRAARLPGVRRRVSVAIYGAPPAARPVEAFIAALTAETANRFADWA